MVHLSQVSRRHSGMTKRGRPAKLTVLRQEEFCELLDAGLTRSAAARLLGCAPSTISKALERDPAFRQRVRQTERAAALHHLEKLELLAPPADRQALRRLLSIRSGSTKPGAANRTLGHRLEAVLFRLAAAQLQTYIDEQ
jgi:hypothetical protein